eukprot:scaffold218290_cov23-Tisochrysis_lutea.AAC.1
MPVLRMTWSSSSRDFLRIAARRGSSCCARAHAAHPMSSTSSERRGELPARRIVRTAVGRVPASASAPSLLS